MRTGDGEACGFGLVLRILDRFKSHPAIGKPAVVVGAVAGGIDILVSGSAVLVDHDAIGAGDAGGAGEVVIGDAADAHQNEIGGKPGAACKRDSGDPPARAVDRDDRFARQHIDTGLPVGGVKKLGNERAHRAFQQAGHAFDDGDFLAGLCRRGRHFEADESASDDDDLRGLCESGLQVDRVGNGSQITDAIQLRAGHRYPACTRSRCDNELVEGESGVVVQFDLPGVWIDADGAMAENQIDTFVLEEGLVAQDQIVFAGRAEQKTLRQRRPLIREPCFIADDGDVVGVAGLARTERGLDSGIRRADDDEAAHDWFSGTKTINSSMDDGILIWQLKRLLDLRGAVTFDSNSISSSVGGGTRPACASST